MRRSAKAIVKIQRALRSSERRVNDDGVYCEPEADGCGCYNALFCAGGTSQTAPSCPTSCTADSECDASCHCDGTCESDLPNGSGCDENSDCISANCVNGVCCDAGGEQCCTTDTVCSYLNSSAVCNNTTTCQGTSSAGQCNTTTFQCEATITDDDSACASGTGGVTCGCAQDQTCTGGATQTPPQCPATGCTGELDSDCKGGCHCDASTCLTDLPDGSACDEASDCQSGYCNNGFCCTNDGSDPVCCGAAGNCPASFTEASVCWSGSKDYAAEFSGTQNGDRWFYQSYNAVTSFADLTFSGGTWTNGADITVSSTQVTPGNDAAVIGYDVPGSGELQINATFADASSDGGTGCRSSCGTTITSYRSVRS